MHDYLATDGDSSIRPDEEADARRQFYSGYRDKNKARLSSMQKWSVVLTVSEIVQIIRRSPHDTDEGRTKRVG
jgi:Xaa-Pro aminopeptidase